MKNKLRVLTILMPVALVLSFAVVFSVGSDTKTARAFDYNKMPKIQKRLLSGFLTDELNPGPGPLTSKPTNYFPNVDECDRSRGDNIKVNQNCESLSDIALAGRAQANNETSIAFDPYNPSRMVSSSNDYRRGDGSCVTYYSSDRGRNWNDSTPPMGFVSGAQFNGTARQYWQAGGDTSVAFDSQGNAYLSCQVFNRGFPTTQDPDQSSAFLIFRSTKNGGASWNFPGRVVVGVQDNTGAVLLDKQLMTVDNRKGSPFQDRVYVSWTLFAADGTAYIYEAYSKDYGETFSAPVLVSKDSGLCPNSFGIPTPNGRCNENQFSQPFVGPDGALYVAWANFNNGVGKPVGDPDAGGGNGNAGAAVNTAANPLENFNQMLLVKSTDGGASFSSPVLVGQYYDLPDCATYQAGNDPGRACVPEKGATANSFFRATNYPVGAVNPRKPDEVVVTYGSYINPNSNEKNGCSPNGFSQFGINTYSGVKTVGACNNDILVSVSENGGSTFTGTTTNPRKMTSANPDRNQRTSDQWFQWAAFDKGGKLAVSYYDRQFGDDEMSGNSDFSVSASDNLKNFGVIRASSSSMPPPTQFAGTFWGDYTGMAVIDEIAYPIWSDTRNPELVLCPGTATAGVPPALCTTTAANAPLANDQDIYVSSTHIIVR